jgi:hypothetical protein
MGLSTLIGVFWAGAVLAALGISVWRRYGGGFVAFGAGLVLAVVASAACSFVNPESDDCRNFRIAAERATSGDQIAFLLVAAQITADGRAVSGSQLDRCIADNNGRPPKNVLEALPPELTLHASGE